MPGGAAAVHLYIAYGDTRIDRQLGAVDCFRRPRPDQREIPDGDEVVLAEEPAVRPKRVRATRTAKRPGTDALGNLHGFAGDRADEEAGALDGDQRVGRKVVARCDLEPGTVGGALEIISRGGHPGDHDEDQQEQRAQE
jgi:hypothetical protein